MDPMEKFRKELLHRQKKDMHLKFFNEDPHRQHIRVPIFSKLSPKKQITPFRNLDCLKAGCIYDEEDLIEKYKTSHMSSLHGFLCYSCSTFIEIQRFYLDYTLKKMIDHIWEKYNKVNKIVCDGVTIMRDGKWEPQLPEYLKHLEKNQAQRKESGLSQLRVTGAHESQMKTLVELEHPPNLREFDQSEYREMYQGFVSKKLGENEIYLNKDGVHIKVDDIRKLEQEEAVNSRIVALFINYLNLLQKIERGNGNKRNQCRCYFSAVNVLSYDKYYKKAKYEFFPGMRNEYRNNSERIYEEFDKAILVLKYDDRWMCIAIELKSSRYYITDFLAEDLSKVKFDEILDVVKEIAQREFGLRYEIQEFYDQKKLNFLSDCGIYVLNYIYKCMNNPVLDVIQVKFLEKDLFRKQLLWLIFKMRHLKKKEVQIFDFPEDDGQDKGQMQYGSSRQKNRQSQGSLQMGKKPSENLQLFDFPNEPSLNLNSNNDLSGIRDSLPLLSAKGNNRVPTLLNSQSDFNLNGSRFNTPHGIHKKSTIVGLRGVSSQDSIIELPKNQLQEILDDFRKEVEGTIKKEKAKNKKNKPSLDYSEDSHDSSYASPQYNKKKNKRNDSSYSSNSMSRSMSSNNSSLPSIYRNGYIPNYDGGYQGYNPYTYGTSQSAMSDSDSLGSADLSDDDDVSDMSLFAEIIKKAKKKDRQKLPDEDLFNYSRDQKAKKSKNTGKKSKKGKKKLDHINEEDEDKSMIST